MSSADENPELSAPDPAVARPSADDSQARESDPLGVAAIVCGCVGVVAFGIVLAIVTGLIAAIAGRQAREARRSEQNAYIAFALAAFDGIVWLVLHMIFDLKWFAG